MTLTLNLGPMFAGKTTRAIEIYKENDTRFKKAVKPSFDTRDGAYIQDHNGNRISAETFDKSCTFGDLCETQLVIIDEVQFMSENLVSVLVSLSHYREIHCFGLDYDWKGNTFPIVEELRGRAQEVIMYNGKCARCDEPSEYSAKLVQRGSILDVGGEDKYIPLCVNCFREHRDGV